MTVEHSMAGGAECFVSQDADCSMAGCTFLIGSAFHHPSPLHALHHSCKWGSVVPMSISL